MPLSSFSPPVQRWFERAFDAPTPVQAQAWPAIAAGENVLLAAPTGSGKTLAAFLWALDRLLTEPSEAAGTRIVYVSPLKALAYDIERNLRTPLRGIGAHEVGVAIRTGDTPQRERAAMARNPPDILITTPESLYLLLTSKARAILGAAQAVIVDEIHAVAHSKRGSHLALTLERLQGLLDSPLQRIGLSATQSPLEEIGRFLVGPRRRVTIVDATGPLAADSSASPSAPLVDGAAPARVGTKALDLRIEVPVESMAEPGLGGAEPQLEPLSGGEPTQSSIWPAIYPELLALVQAHNSTIVFVNSRRSAERVALRLNELAESEIARAHHGSLALAERTKVEQLLKAGQLPCLVATSSLELGIDMGAVDLVVQIESPKSVARGLQRIGRAGHGVGEVSKGRIFPKFRGDLLECAVVCRRMREGLIESTVVPRNALDVLAQQIVAIAVAAEPAPAGPSNTRVDTPAHRADVEPCVSVDALHALVTSAYPYCTLSRELLENVLDMLDGRYPSQAFGELRARIVWDRLAGTIRARPGARQLAIVNAGTIPDRGLYAVTLPDGRRVGELDEEMVYEARAGQVFLLGASTWRIEEIGRDRVIVTPAPGARGAVPFWKGDSVGRPKELGEAIGAFSRWAVEQDAPTIGRAYDLDERAALNLLAYLREQQAATRVLPSERTIVLERFRDEIGDWRLCVLSPFGGRVHAAWALAVSARIRERYGLEADVIYSDDGIVLHLPDLDADSPGEPPPGGEAGDAGEPLPSSAAELVLLEPDEVEQMLTVELGGSALFGARFRENAARALLIPRAYPGRRTPLWQQRLKAQSLLEVARRYSDFPIVLETYRECLADVLDVPGLQDVLRRMHTREISLVEVETPRASPYASSLLFDYVATYMYEGDTPNAERRAAALSLDRELLRELLGSEELRELIDPGALERVQDDLQHRSELTRATGRDELHDVLRRLGDLTRHEIAERVFAGIDAQAMLSELESERRVVALRVGSEQRHIAADHAGLYRDALACAPPGGLPESFLGDVPDALAVLVGRYARTHGPFTTAELRERYGVDASAVLRELERAGQIVHGELRPGTDGEPPPSGREWCDVEVLRRLRRASLAALRKEIEPVQRDSLAAFMPAWQGVDRHSSSGAGIDRLREILVPLQGLALAADMWERDVLPRRTGAYSPTWLDSLCASGELVWVGAGALGRAGRVALYFREDAPFIGPPPAQAPPAGEEAPERALLRARLAGSPCFFSDLLAELDVPSEALREALWDLVWAGEVTNDAFAPLRAPHLSLAPGRAPQRLLAARRSSARRFSARRTGAQSQVQGRWSLTASIFAPERTAALTAAVGTPGAVGTPAAAGTAQAVTESVRRRALAELLLERYGIVTREQVRAEGVKGGFTMLYDTFSQLETLGVCRRGYFIEGMGGAQFALPGAVERLRAVRTGSSALAARERAGTLLIAAADPAQPYGAALPWPKRDGRERRVARVAGAYVVLVAGQPALYVERGGRGLVTLGDESLDGALSALAEAVRSGRVGKLALERIDGEPAIASELAGALRELGFQSGPRRLTLSA